MDEWDEEPDGGPDPADGPPRDVTYTDLLRELIAQRPKPKEASEPRPLVVVGWDPLMLPAGGQRMAAWWRLAAFVDWLNAVFGAYRTPSGEAPRWVRAGWWANPLAVAHLAALARAWGPWLVSRDPLTGGDGPVRLLLEQTTAVLDLVCGIHSASSQWGMNHMAAGNATFSLDVPPGEPDREECRRLLEEFVATDVEVAEQTGFASGLLAEMAAEGGE